MIGSELIRLFEHIRQDVTLTSDQWTIALNLQAVYNIEDDKIKNRITM
jgi:hypothetical protein